MFYDCCVSQQTPKTTTSDANTESSSLTEEAGLGLPSTADKHKRLRYLRILRVHSIPRAACYGLVALMLAMMWHEAPLLYTVLIALGLIEPWLIYAWAVRQPPKRLTLVRTFRFDAVNAGISIAALGFSIGPTIFLFGANTLSALTLEGPRDALKQAGLIALSALLSFFIMGQPRPELPPMADMLALIGLMFFAFPSAYATWLAYEQLRVAWRRVREQSEAFKQASRTDSLTGLANRRPVYDLMRKLGGEPWALILLDMDRFKSINDTYGHEAGDVVLQVIAQRLLKLLPEPDLVVRWGGEELFIVLRKPRNEPLEQFAEHILEAIRREPVTLPDGQTLAVTASCGAAHFQREVGWRRLLATVDRALYLAKHGGRDRAIVVDAARFE
ncbi:MAG: diguanylate cyclase [Casimicrobiaceae bacterium]|nr:diguanylate cyclase [Casimicrobiaceae bacterium]